MTKPIPPTFFNNDYRTNTIYRAFANIEWRMLDSLILMQVVCTSKEDINDRVFSPPRVAVNWLLTEQQSLRLVYSQAVRSPICWNKAQTPRRTLPT